MRQITPTQLRDYLTQANPKPALIDVREPWEYDICAIEDSMHIPMGQIPQRSAAMDTQSEVVVICHHGARSMHVAMYLERMGFQNVINLAGGIEAWALEVAPDMARY